MIVADTAGAPERGAPETTGAETAARLGRMLVEIRQAGDFGDVLRIAGVCLADLSKADRVDNMRLIGTTGDVRFTQIGGWRDPSAETEVILPSADLPMRGIIKRGELVRSPITPQTSGAAFPSMQRAGMRHMLLVPLKVGAQVFGGIRMATRSETGFDDDDEVVTAHVSYLLSGWLMHRQLERRLRRTEETANRYATRLELLNDSSEAMAQATTEEEVFSILGATVDQIMAHDSLFFVTVSDCGTTLLATRLDDGGLADHRPVEFDFATSRARQIMESGQVTHVPDVAALPEADAVAMRDIGMRSSLNVPVRSEGDVFSQLVLGSTAYKAFDAEDTQVLSMLSRLTGATLDRVKVTAQLEHRARHDGLTALANRAEFDRRLALTLADVEQSQEDATLCYLDLDHFKRINDTFGHAAGDALLVELAERLRSNTSERDLVARIGGDEFVILLRACAIDQAGKVIERLREVVHAHGFDWEGQHTDISLSAGLARITPGITADTLLKNADEACYQAKRDGRNQVVSP